jgi:hypothetical protein
MVGLVALAASTAEKLRERITEFFAQNSDSRGGIDADPNPIRVDPQHRQRDCTADAYSLARLPTEDEHGDPPP